MLTPTALLQKYYEIISNPTEIASCYSGECVSILYTTNWVKILVIRSQDSEGDCSIEVEISLPTCVIEPTPSSPNVKQKEARTFIESTISHFDYFLRLQDIGFKLGIISTEGIWSAVIGMKGIEVERLFETLLPPSWS